MSTIDIKNCRRIWKTWKTIKKHSRKNSFWDETSIIDKRKFSRNTILLRKLSNITISKFISIVLLCCTKIYDYTFSNLRSLIDLSMIWKKKTQRNVFQIRQFQFKLTLYQIIVNAIIFEKQNTRVYFHRFKYNQFNDNRVFVVAI